MSNAPKNQFITLNPVHKVFLHDRFYMMGPSGEVVQKKVPLQFLPEACSLLKKLLIDTERIEREGGVAITQFLESAIDFTAEEKVFIRKLLSEVKELEPGYRETYQELKELFA